MFRLIFFFKIAIFRFRFEITNVYNKILYNEIICRINMDDNTSTKLEAAAFRRLLSHLNERTDVQNIDLMNLAGFCRNCLSRWYKEESIKLKNEVSDEEAREIVYGMPYKDWKDKFQKEASKEQMEKLKKNHTN